ncbi:MAG: hypothetical protein N0E38_12205 [Candidatus Thiodiazotropha endolucinida]|nr:hypothetical protein [Candidatus Thiodiazotropha taylori]MCW4349702.1 hypothetical protein [Candidatus Thiodiazotropha endolucinida]
MRRFSLIGRLGPDDKAKVPVLQRDSAIYEIDFLNSDRRLDFGIGHALDQLGSFGLNPTEVALDLVMLAALVNAGDTRVSRAANAQDGWTREMDLYIPVSDTAIWDGVSRKIEDLLRFLTGDRWRLFFRDRPRRLSSIIVPADKLPLGGLDEVCLFSGGLDSLIGAIDLLKDGRRPLLVSHYWDAETSKAQTYLLERLRRRFPTSELRSVRVRVGFDRHHLNTGETEDTQRGRSFLFFALASLAASAFARSVTINVPENGLIALNVPLDSLRFGALSTRTAHPHFIAGMNRLLLEIGVQATLVNKYRHNTKGEMVAACADLDFLQREVGSSMSCSSPAKARYKKLSPRHCGYCVPCLIRRASLKKGLGLTDPTLYTIPDLSAQTLFTDRSEGENIRSFQLLAARIEKQPELANILVHKPGPLIDAPSEVPAYADVFRRGILEVAALLDGVTAEPS